MIRPALAVLLALASLAPLHAAEPEYSTAGFFAVPGSPRQAFDFNVGWRFHRGATAGAEARDFNDAAWPLVNAPHGVDGALPEEASGCANYRGPAWYRKKFTPAADLRGRRVTLHFEGILGKSKIWLNGRLLKEHFSGFLPAIVDVTDLLDYGKPNLVAVLADNSDDPSFPPGKPQAQLDYSYFGGIYRDVRLIATGPVHITDPNEVDIVAGGGVFAHTEKLDEREAVLVVTAHLANTTDTAGEFAVAADLAGPDGQTVATDAGGPARVSIPARGSVTVTRRLTVAHPRAWSPDSPVMHDLFVRVTNAAGAAVDTQRTRVGLRTLRITHAEGLVLNGKPFDGKLMGANRHQDHAVVGFALSNNLHRRDVQKLRDAGMRVIRSAHYPQDPAFMDACDELGMFVIVNTPGWQFWGKGPFEQRVYADVRNMVRRDRNHPSVLLWEPVLNETSYPDHFAKNVHDMTHAEYPYPGCHTSADSHAPGHGHFDVLFAHPPQSERGEAPDKIDKTKAYFTREWGDNVDDWDSHNSPSRVARAWGEVPQLVQAKHYAHPDYTYSCWETLATAPQFHFGGTLWHSFDHQRGYHPDPFLGGIMDAFRRPKFSYELFRAQRPANLRLTHAESGPMVFVAHAMTPFSPAEVTVYSNCDAVRLSFNGKVVAEQASARRAGHMPSPIFTFPKVFDFMAMKALQRAGKGAQVTLAAEGLIDGKVVATHTVRPGKRAAKLTLAADTAGLAPVADGSTVMPIIAAVVDRAGDIKRLNDGAVSFTVTGEGELVGDAAVGANPRAVKWGEAPALVRVSTKPGKVRVTARYAPAGSQMPASAVFEFETKPAALPFVQDETPAPGAGASAATPAAPDTGGETGDALRHRLELAEKELQRLRNREVERQQTAFEGGADKVK